MKEIKFHMVTFLDVTELLSIAKRKRNNSEDMLREELRVEEELQKFIALLEKNTKFKIHHMGHEKSYGVHLVRYMIRNNGFIEFIVDKPLTINAYFIEREKAKVFANGLKKTLREVIPDSPISDQVIDSVTLMEKNNVLHLEKWAKMHAISLNKAVVISAMTVIVFTTIEATQEFFEAVAGNLLHVHTIIISIVTALIIGFLFDPIKTFIENLMEKNVVK